MKRRAKKRHESEVHKQQKELHSKAMDFRRTLEDTASLGDGWPNEGIFSLNDLFRNPAKSNENPARREPELGTGLGPGHRLLRVAAPVVAASMIFLNVKQAFAKQPGILHDDSKPGVAQTTGVGRKRKSRVFKGIAGARERRSISRHQGGNFDAELSVETSLPVRWPKTFDAPTPTPHPGQVETDVDNPDFALITIFEDVQKQYPTVEARIFRDSEYNSFLYAAKVFWDKDSPLRWVDNPTYSSIERLSQEESKQVEELQKTGIQSLLVLSEEVNRMNKEDYNQVYNLLQQLIDRYNHNQGQVLTDDMLQNIHSLKTTYPGWSYILTKFGDELQGLYDSRSKGDASSSDINTYNKMAMGLQNELMYRSAKLRNKWFLLTALSIATEYHWTGQEFPLLRGLALGSGVVDARFRTATGGDLYNLVMIPPSGANHADEYSGRGIYQDGKSISYSNFCKETGECVFENGIPAGMIIGTPYNQEIDAAVLGVGYQQDGKYFMIINLGEKTVIMESTEKGIKSDGNVLRVFVDFVSEYYKRRHNLAISLLAVQKYRLTYTVPFPPHDRLGLRAVEITSIGGDAENSHVNPTNESASIRLIKFLPKTLQEWWWNRRAPK